MSMMSPLNHRNLQSKMIISYMHEAQDSQSNILHNILVTYLSFNELEKWQDTQLSTILQCEGESVVVCRKFVVCFTLSPLDYWRWISSITPENTL